MRRAPPLAVILLAVATAAFAWPVARGIVEDGTDGLVADGATDGGAYVLSTGNTSVRLRPATCTAGTCTRVAPDAGTEGFDLGDVAAWRVSVCAPNDQVLTAAGKLEFWLYDPAISSWGHMGAKDLSVTVTDHCQAFPVELNGMQASSFKGLYRPNGVTVSGVDGGSAITSTQACKHSRQTLGCSQ